MLLGGAGVRGEAPQTCRFCKFAKVSVLILSRRCPLRGCGEFKGFAPCRRPPADRLSAEMGNFFYPKLSLVILGSRGTPNGHTQAQMSIFIDFGLEFY